MGEYPGISRCALESRRHRTSGALAPRRLHINSSYRGCFGTAGRGSRNICSMLMLDVRGMTREAERGAAGRYGLSRLVRPILVQSDHQLVGKVFLSARSHERLTRKLGKSVFLFSEWVSNFFSKIYVRLIVKNFHASMRVQLREIAVSTFSTQLGQIRSRSLDRTEKKKPDLL